MNPLLHYLRHGDREGRRPIWHFDPAWYRSAYDLPPDALALAHFLDAAFLGLLRADARAVGGAASGAISR